MPPAALLRGFKRFLQPHTRCRKQARVRFLYRRLRKLSAELLHRVEFACAVLATRDMLLQFVASVVGQLVINVENNVLLYPFALHSCLIGGRARRPSLHDLFLTKLISDPPAFPAI